MTRRRPASGIAAIETVALVPVLALLAVLVLQVAAAIWTATSTDLAVRQAARADSLGGDPRATAQRALPAGLSVRRIQSYGPGHGVRLQVDVPRVSPLPRITITRRMELP